MVWLLLKKSSSLNDVHCIFLWPIAEVRGSAKILGVGDIFSIYRIEYFRSRTFEPYIYSATDDTRKIEIFTNEYSVLR